MIGLITQEALAAAVLADGLGRRDIAAYRAAHPNARAGDLLSAVQTDWYWRIPAIRLADAHAKSASATYMYELAWRAPQFGRLLGACHALDIAFVFDALGNGTAPFWGANPPQQLVDTMHAAWVAFATNGGCGWPKYDLPQGNHAVRYDVERGGPSSIRRAGALGKRALASAAASLEPAVPSPSLQQTAAARPIFQSSMVTSFQDPRHIALRTALYCSIGETEPYQVRGRSADG